MFSFFNIFLTSLSFHRLLSFKLNVFNTISSEIFSSISILYLLFNSFSSFDITNPSLDVTIPTLLTGKISFILGIFEDWEKKTKTTIDDNIVKILQSFLNEVDITASGLQYNPEMKKYFKDLNIKSILDWFVEKLEELAKNTETDVDDEIVAFFKEIINKYL